MAWPSGSPGDRGHLLGEALRAVPGLRPARDADGHRFSLRCGRERARVRVESADCIRVVLELEPCRARRPQPGTLPGNLRLCRDARGWSLVAELPGDPEGLGQRFEELARGLAQAAGRRLRTAPPAVVAPSTEAFAEVCAGMAWAAGEVVPRAGGAELRPRFGGRVAPVQADLCERGLRLHREILPARTGLPRQTLEAVADHALRSNARLRWARLAGDGGQLVAEALLAPAAITPGHLARTARAVAAAAVHTTDSFLVLVREPQVARRYAAVFPHPRAAIDLTTTEPEDPGGTR